MSHPVDLHTEFSPQNYGLSLIQKWVQKNGAYTKYDEDGSVMERGKLPVDDSITYVYTVNGYVNNESDIDLLLFFKVTGERYADVRVMFKDKQFTGYCKSLEDIHKLIISSGFEMSLVRDMRLDYLFNTLCI